MNDSKKNKSRFYDNLTTKELEAIAKQGDVEAQFKLGYRYRYGEKAKKNFAKAIVWYTKAAEQGHAHAQNNLGVCYKRGIGVKKDFLKAVEWYTKAAEQGVPEAQYNIVVFYEYGYGVEKNQAKALEWCIKAADQGADKAQYYLARCYEDGKGVEMDYVKAIEWYRKAAEQGNEEAQHRINLLGDVEARGNGANNKRNSVGYIAADKDVLRVLRKLWFQEVHCPKIIPKKNERIAPKVRQLSTHCCIFYMLFVVDGN